MGAPLFSIIMATHQRDDHIIPSIQSVLRQSFGDFELFVVNDGPLSIDAKRHLDGDRVTWLDLPEHTGSQSSPNNRGIAAARGRWIAYLGHDDIWSAEHLQTVARAIASPAAPDVVISGCLFHGPPGCGVTFVTGLFSDDSAKFEHFFPPSSMAHRREISGAVGGWRQPHALVEPADTDFLLRIARADARFLSTGRVSVHKFAAGHRYLSYLSPDSREQTAALADPKFNDPTAWAGEIVAAQDAGRFMAMRYSDDTNTEPGAAFAANLSNKGIHRPPLRPLTGPVIVAQAGEPRALDWYGLEPGEAPFRWSGPNPRPKVLIPFTYVGQTRISLRILDSDSELESIEVTVGGMKLPTKIVDSDPGRLLVIEAPLKPDAYTILELHTPTMRTPSDTPGMSDSRSLGLALADVGIEPLAHPAGPSRRLSTITGGDQLLSKVSAVDAKGHFRERPIDGVQFRPARPVPHEDGYLTEVARMGWDLLDEPIVQVHATTTLAGRIRAWGLHRHSTDRLFVVSGLVRIAVFDGREGSSSFGRVNTFTVGERNPGLLVIPPNLYHGWRNIGDTEAIILNLPTHLYDYEAPDALDLPWDSEAAGRLIPFSF